MKTKVLDFPVSMRVLSGYVSIMRPFHVATLVWNCVSSLFFSQRQEIERIATQA